MLAHHYREALAFAEAAGIDADAIRGPARAALTAASERAQALHAWIAARSHTQAALALTPEGDPTVPWLQLRLARAAWYEGDLETELVVAARDAFVARGDRVAAAEAEAFYSLVLWYRGEGAAARSQARRSLARPPSAHDCRHPAQAADASRPGLLARAVHPEGDEAVAACMSPKQLSLRIPASICPVAPRIRLRCVGIHNPRVD